MSRARDLRAFQQQTPPNAQPSESARPQQGFRSPASLTSAHDFREREDPSLPPGSAPPMRPQRSAARQPGIIVSNPSSVANSSGTKHSSPAPPQGAPYEARYQHTRGRSDSSNRLASTNLPRPTPSGSSNKLYQAINSRPDMARAPNSTSRIPENGNGYLDRNYRARDDGYPSEPRNRLLNDNEQRPSTASSTGSFDNEGNRDLLSANDLRDAKRMHGARNIIEAFSTQADKRSNQKARTVRSPPPMDQSESRMIPSMFHDQSYPRTPGFGEIERVLQKIKLSWDATGIAGSSNQDGPFGYSVTSSTTVPFSAVGLALDLLDSENPELAKSASRAKDMINKKGGMVPSLSAFLQLKAELEKALQLTIQGNYRQFDASVNCYKLAKVSVDSNYKKVAELKSKLVECRATLGNGSPSSAFNNAVGGKGTEMKVLQARREVLREMLKLMDTIERLKQVPERLEGLISSKSFLSATVLLVRSLKVINKPELAEIGGLSDLRSYLVNQESVMFEMLIEELHNHLYLKNYFCNSKWRAYRPGQVTLPVIQTPDESATAPFGFSFDSDPTAAHPSSYHASASSRQHKNTENCNGPSSPIPYLRNYLNDLMTQPQSNPLVEEADLFLELSSTSLHSEMGTEHARKVSTSTGGMAANKRRNQSANPELDSFKYIESLIESFAVLGKLSLGLDTVLQRVPVEVYTLVESTLNEVDERHENTKRFFRSSSTNKNALKSNMNMIVLMITTSQASPPGNPELKSTSIRANQRFSLFKLNNNELRELESVIHILQDFFWTLYSKFDATLQSFRVLHEVSLRISERKSFKEEGMESNLVLFSLLEVWKPIQSELLALIHAYLTESGDDQFASTDKMQANSINKSSATTSTTRNPMASIAEVLKIGLGGTTSTSNANTAWKDSNKQLFKFKDAGAKQTQKDFKAHEANLYSALKVSVPGLVLDSTASNLQANGAVVLTTGVMMTDDNSGARGNSTHKLLVQPDAFHIAHLFKPTLEFLKRAKEVLPSGVVMVSNDDPSHSSAPISGADETGLTSITREDWDENAQMNLAQFGGFSGFLDEFVLHTFLPQLEEKVIYMFEHSVNAPDAFQDDTSQQHETNAPAINSVSNRQKQSSHVPIAKSLRAIVALIECLVGLLQSTSFHQEKYGRLMISIVVQYYQKCLERFKELVVRESTETAATIDETNPHANLKLAADWAQKPEIIKHLNLLKSSTDKNSTKKLLKKLCKREERCLTSRADLAPIDLIQSSKKVAALAHLYNTLLSFMSFIRRLGSTVKPIPDAEGESRLEIDQLEAEWSKEFGPSAKKASFQMPLTHSLMRRFQMVHRSFSALAQTIMFTMHLELRLETYYHIQQTFVRGNYFLSRSDSIEPDAKIIELNSLISSYSESSILKNLVRTEDRRFPFLGLVNLIDDLMISNVKKLSLANEIGFKKLAKNAIALQQNMKSVLLSNRLLYPQEPSNDLQMDSNIILPIDAKSSLTLDLNFERCRKFWEIASKGPQAVMGSIRRGDNYKFEEYRQLLELLCLNDRSPAAARTSSVIGHQHVDETQRNSTRQDDTESSSRASLKFPDDFHDHTSPSIEKRKRIYNECLIELHALVLEDDDDETDDDNEIDMDNTQGSTNKQANALRDQTVHSDHPE